MRVLIWIIALGLTVWAGDRPQSDRVFHLEKAALRGDTDAMTQLGLAYSQGYGVTKDYAMSLRWFDQAAQKGHPVAAKLKLALERKLDSARMPASQ